MSNSLQYYMSDIRAEVARRGGAWKEFLRYTNPLELVYSCAVDARRGQMPRAYFEMLELASFFGLALAAPAVFCVSLAGRGALDALATRRGGRLDDLYANLDLPPTAPLSLATLVSLRAVYAGGVDIITADSSSGAAASAPDLWCQIAHALCLQKKGGSLVVRVCDVFTHTAVDVLALLASCYASVVVAKPQVCDSTSSEKYVVCRGFVFDKYAAFYDILCASLTSTKLEAVAPDARVLSCAVSLHFMSHVGVCNAVMGQRQIEAMHAALLLIDGATKPFRLGCIAEANRRRCAEWCERHALSVADAPAYAPPTAREGALQGGEDELPCVVSR